VIDLVRGGEHTVAFDEPAYTVHASGNAEFETRTLRFVYTSMTTPASTFDYQLGSRERVLKKRQPVPGYDPTLYQSERVMAKAADGTEVPISLVWRRDRKRRAAAAAALRLRQLRHRPGSLVLADAGVAARSRRDLRDRPHPRRRRPRPHLVRGRQDGKKATTFSDFIACAEALIARGLTTPASSRSRAAAPAAC
jgi:oligopeptidase B